MSSERWLITGASGQLGSHVVRRLAGEEPPPTLLAVVRHHDIGTANVPTRRLELVDAAAIRACVRDFAPTHILHLAAMTAVGDCHDRPEEAWQVNAAATGVLAEAAGRQRARLVFASTDMVFGGDRAPYRESDPPAPRTHYGRTKLAAEQLLAGCDRALSVRLPLIYGLPLHGRPTTFAQQVAALRSRQPLRLFTDEFRTPVWLADAARALVALARSDVDGVIHLGGPERLSRFELVARAAELLGIAEPALVPISRLEFDSPEPRPADVSLRADRLAELLPDCLPGAMRPAVFDPPA